MIYLADKGSVNIYGTGVIYLAQRDLYVLFECRSHTPYLHIAQMA